MPGSRYLATIIAAGCPMHLEARQVHRDGVQVTFTEFGEDYDAISSLDPDGSSGCSEIYDPHAANGRDFWTAETASIKVPLWRLRQRCGEMPERTTVGAR